MGIYTILLPDLGEGIAEAELSEWNVKIGDVVKEDDVLGTVMTDKAAFEVPSLASGSVTWLAGQVGEVVSIGGEFVKLEVLGRGNENKGAGEAAATDPAPAAAPEKSAQQVEQPTTTGRVRGEKTIASPSVRKRAQNEGIELSQIAGSGPDGRISHGDLDDFIAQTSRAPAATAPGQNKDVETIKIVGMRRKIAQRMALSKSRIPHITIVEEVDVQSLENLRAELNEKYKNRRIKLTLLPFVMRAIVAAVGEHREINACFDDEAGVVYQYGGVHIGIATQTPRGLTVPVVKHVETLSAWQCAKEISRLAEASRSGKVARDELSGSTITITSLGALGAVATTPIINHPEVAIVGINKMAIRPLWDGEQFQPRKMMNISCSFDHRVIDGLDAAEFVQKLKSLLEAPENLVAEGHNDPGES